MQMIKETIRGFRKAVENYQLIIEEITQIENNKAITPELKTVLISLKQRSLNTALNQLANDLDVIETYLETLDDHELRAIIRAHYLLGDSWTCCTKRILQHDHSDAAKSRVYRHFRSMGQ